MIECRLGYLTVCGSNQWHQQTVFLVHMLISCSNSYSTHVPVCMDQLSIWRNMETYYSLWFLRACHHYKERHSLSSDLVTLSHSYQHICPMPWYTQHLSSLLLHHKSYSTRGKHEWTQYNQMRMESISVCNIHRRIVLLARMHMTAHCTAGS